MAKINYQQVGWDTTKYFNPTNMNQMDNGIKAACDKADANEESIADVNNKLGNTDISAIGDGTVTGGLNALNSNLFSDNPYIYGNFKSVAMASNIVDKNANHLYQIEYSSNDGHGNIITSIFADSVKIGEIGYSLNRDINNGGNRITGIGVDDGGVFLHVDGAKYYIQLK